MASKILPKIAIFCGGGGGGGCGKKYDALVQMLVAKFRNEYHFPVTTIWSPTLIEARTLATTHHIPHWSDNIDSVLLSTEVTLIVIACGTKFHCQIVTKACNIGKHVVQCNWPPAQNVAESNMMRLAAANYPTLISAQFTTLRHTPAFEVMRHLILSDHLIGDILTIDAVATCDVTTINEHLCLGDDGLLSWLGVNMIDVISYVTGLRACKVHAIMRNFHRQHSSELTFQHQTVEDYVNIQMEMISASSSSSSSSSSSVTTATTDDNNDHQHQNNHARVQANARHTDHYPHYHYHNGSRTHRVIASPIPPPPSSSSSSSSPSPVSSSPSTFSSSTSTTSATILRKPKCERAIACLTLNGFQYNTNPHQNLNQQQLKHNVTHQLSVYGTKGYLIFRDGYVFGNVRSSKEVSSCQTSSRTVIDSGSSNMRMMTMMIQNHEKLFFVDKHYIKDEEEEEEKVDDKEDDEDDTTVTFNDNKVKPQQIHHHRRYTNVVWPKVYQTALDIMIRRLQWCFCINDDDDQHIDHIDHIDHDDDHNWHHTIQYNQTNGQVLMMLPNEPPSSVLVLHKKNDHDHRRHQPLLVVNGNGNGNGNNDQCDIEHTYVIRRKAPPPPPQASQQQKQQPKILIEFIDQNSNNLTPNFDATPTTTTTTTTTTKTLVNDNVQLFVDDGHDVDEEVQQQQKMTIKNENNKQQKQLPLPSSSSSSSSSVHQVNCHWSKAPLRDTATFEEAHYLQAVLNAARQSDQTHSWIRLGVEFDKVL